ncbi:hypothetical protein Ahy_B04g071198 [Arachis hypogaea]|uniref:Aminotransferase-like plant mobile domain-containing protein n=1 Tax=Arachis hypogaea TaxID=3818 RepID=A0A444ZK94_ARAHY|nr:hypothetical protein Ahy_B04g071198 [Arachis hypogaea]
MLFGDKSGARVHLHWLPYVADLDGLGKYSWGSATLSWLYRCLSRVADRNVKNLAGPLALLQSWIFWRFPTFKSRGFDVILWPLAPWWGRYMPSSEEKGPRVITTQHRLDRCIHHTQTFDIKILHVAVYLDAILGTRALEKPKKERKKRGNEKKGKGRLKKRRRGEKGERRHSCVYAFIFATTAAAAVDPMPSSSKEKGRVTPILRETETV